MIAYLQKPGRSILPVFLLLLLVGTACPARSSVAQSYTFAVVPQYDQRQLFSTWKPLLDVLQARTGLSLKLVIAAGIPAFEKQYEQGQYDFVYLNPYHLLRANQFQGYVPVVRDSLSLRGVLVVRKDSPLRDVTQLNGKVIAFPSPHALGASLLMRADLSLIYGLSIAPLYVNSHDSVYLYVVKGLADAGGGVEKTFEQQEKQIREALRILYVTRDMPSHPIAVHPRVPGADAERLSSALLELAATKEGQELLAKIPMKQPIATSLDDYAMMREWGLDSFRVEE